MIFSSSSSFTLKLRTLSVLFVFYIRTVCGSIIFTYVDTSFQFYLFSTKYGEGDLVYYFVRRIFQFYLFSTLRSLRGRGDGVWVRRTFSFICFLQYPLHRPGNALFHFQFYLFSTFLGSKPRPIIVNSDSFQFYLFSTRSCSSSRWFYPISRSMLSVLFVFYSMGNG